MEKVEILRRNSLLLLVYSEAVESLKIYPVS